MMMMMMILMILMILMTTGMNRMMMNLVGKQPVRGGMLGKAPK